MTRRFHYETNIYVDEDDIRHYQGLDDEDEIENWMWEDTAHQKFENDDCEYDSHEIV